MAPTSKLTVSLNSETTETNLFVSGRFKTNFGSFDMNRGSLDTLRRRLQRGIRIAAVDYSRDRTLGFYCIFAKIMNGVYN